MAEPAKHDPSPTPERVKSYGAREDGTPKGPGFFGEVPRLDDPEMFSGELSATGDLKTPDGKPVLFGQCRSMYNASGYTCYGG